MIIELKSNQTASRAVAQIQNKEYFYAFDNFSGKMLFVGINYDEKKKHTCEIVLSFNLICTIILSAHSLPQYSWDVRVSSRSPF